MLSHAHFVNGLRLSALTQTAFAPSLNHSLPSVPIGRQTEVATESVSPQRIHSANSDHEDVDVEKD